MSKNKLYIISIHFCLTYRILIDHINVTLTSRPPLILSEVQQNNKYHICSGGKLSNFKKITNMPPFCSVVEYLKKAEKDEDHFSRFSAESTK